MIRHVSYYLARALDQITSAAEDDRKEREQKKIEAAEALAKLKWRDTNHG